MAYRICLNCGVLDECYVNTHCPNCELPYPFIKRKDKVIFSTSSNTAGNGK